MYLLYRYYFECEDFVAGIAWIRSVGKQLTPTTGRPIYSHCCSVEGDDSGTRWV